MSTLLKNTDFEVFTGFGMMRLDSGLVAKCELVDLKCKNDFSALRVTIMNARAAKTDHVDFEFNELLQAQDETANDPFFVVRDINGWDWFGETPTPQSVKLLIDGVSKYVNFFIN